MSSSSGKLEPLKLFKVFRSVLERRLGGTLTLRRGQVVKQARLAFGQIIAAGSNRPEESLARALVEEGLISSTERVEIDQARRADRRSFEAHVRERGLVAEGRLESIERRLSRARMLECFGWPDGTFQFEVAQVRTSPKKRPIDTVELLLEAAARQLPTPVCERFLAGFARQNVRPTDWMGTYANAFDSLFPPPNLRGLMQSPLPVAGLGSMPGDKARNLREGAAMILAGLATLDGVGGDRPARPRTASGARPAQPRTASGARGTQPRTASGGQPRRPVRTGAGGATSPRAAGSSAANPGDAGPRRRAERSVPPRPAAVAPHPTRSEPPQREAPPRPARASEQSEDRPVRMRASRGPRAVRAESGAARTRRSDSRRASGASRRSSGASRRASGAAARTSPGEPKPVPPKIQANLDRAKVLAAELDTRTHYEVLDIESSADEKAIRLAFRRMARDFHVDRFARYGLDKETLGAVQKVFVAANKAHEVLSSAEKRKEYDIGLEMKAGGAKVAPGGGGPQLDQVFKAEKLIKDATVLIGRGQPDAALERLKVAAPVLPEDPVLLAAQAFAEHLVAQGQGGSQVITRRTREALEEICAELENREEPFLYLGRIYRTLDESEKAIRAFEKALKINPHYAEAGSELRHAQRKVEQNKSGLAGLFGRRKK